MSQGTSPPRFVFLLNRAHRAVQRWVETRPSAWEGASSAQAGLLFFLRSRRNATIGEIAAALDVAPAAVTNLSKRMQAADLVERVSDEHDARMTRLQLTPSGETASAQADRALQELNAHLKAGFTDAELAVVARWLAHATTLESVV
jgi:DNA-binding MarR family transcriptional regulator